MSRTIFISYDSHDQRAATVIAQGLLRAGFDVFYDKQAIVAGDEWSDSIKAALRRSAAVLVLLSKNTYRGTYAATEVQIALDSKVLVVPILLDDKAKQNWLWPLVAQRQSVMLDLESPTAEEGLNRLVGEIALLLHENRVTRVQSAWRSSVWITVLVGLASAVAGALGAWLLR